MPLVSNGIGRDFMTGLFNIYKSTMDVSYPLWHHLLDDWIGVYFLSWTI